MTSVSDKEALCAVYEDVRSDNTDTTWSVLKFEGNEIILGGTGIDYQEFIEHFNDDERLFGFVRIQTGDEMSKRAKFALITWIGQNVSPLKRAKMSTDKTLVKAIFQNFAVEIQTSELDEIQEEYVRAELMKAGGANYGTGGV